MLITTAITFFIIRKGYNRIYPNKKLIYPIGQSLISFGFIACYLFMALNYFLADRDIVVKSFPINRTKRIFWL